MPIIDIKQAKAEGHPEKRVISWLELFIKKCLSANGNCTNSLQ